MHCLTQFKLFPSIWRMQNIWPLVAVLRWIPHGWSTTTFTHGVKPTNRILHNIDAKHWHASTVTTISFITALIHTYNGGSFHCRVNSSLFKIRLINSMISKRTVPPPVWNLISTRSFISFQLFNTHLKVKGTGLRHKWLWPKSLTPPPFNNWRSESYYHSKHCSNLQATHVSHCLLSYRAATRLNYICSSTEVSNVLLVVSFKLINCSFQIFPSLFLKRLLVWRLTLVV